MKTFTTLLDTEKAKKTGASPVWILKIPFIAGTVYLSDRVFTCAGWTIKAWVAGWGSIDEAISDEMGSPQVSEFAVDLIIDPDEATDIHDLLWSESVETLRCELYLWFEGLTVATDPPVLMWAGNIIDFEKVSEQLYNVSLVDESVRIDKYPGRVLSLADYPNASLDDVGYQMTIAYGSVVKVPALRLDVGKKTSLISAITAAATDFYLTDGTGLANTDHILIDAEEIHITTITTNHITACTRGVSSTAAAHSSGVLVLEKQTTAVFLFADHPVKSIDNIYALRADGVPVDVTSLCTKYTGQGGANDLAGYAGLAVITCPGYITFNLAVALGLTDTIAVVDTIAVNDGIGVSDTIGSTAVTDGESIETRFCSSLPDTIEHDTGWGYGTYASMPTGTTLAKWYEIGWHATVTTPLGAGDEVTIYVNIANRTDICKITHAGLVPLGASPIIVDINNGNWTAGTIGITKTGAAGGDWVVTIDYVKMVQTKDLNTAMTKTGAATKTGTASKSGAASKSGTVVLTNNNLTNFAVGDRLLITGKGYQDGGAALIERPDLIMEHFLYTYCAWPVADFEHTDAAVALAADSYKFSVVINTRKRMKEWLAYMAFQCRCWFRFASGKAYLLYRPDSLVSDKTIAKFADNEDFTTTMKIARSPLDEIINKIDLHYQRDWSKATGAEAYQAVVTVQDAVTSIPAYGEKESPNLFLFDFIQDATMAADLAAFYLARYKDRKKVVTGDIYLDNIELEFADAVTLTEAGGILCEVRKVGITPGKKDEMDKIILTAREY